MPLWPPGSGTQNERQQVKLADAYSDFLVDLAWVEGEVLPDAQAIVNAGLAGERLVARSGEAVSLDLALRVGSGCPPLVAQVMVYSFDDGVLLFIAVGCGVFWGWMRWRTGGLVAPLVCHLAWDVMVFSLLPLVR